MTMVSVAEISKPGGNLQSTDYLAAKANRLRSHLWHLLMKISKPMSGVTLACPALANRGEYLSFAWRAKRVTIPGPKSGHVPLT
ncbi:hypothetical protein I7I50_11766 [Histoplasma capsulatum G186AR]|nr:hypothetical protein I7I52_03004 [Histoplasma capsulatum]QSS70208.1 hypothetical protein I7I50_11766 [Histoplasma capsulatum G186AR]